MALWIGLKAIAILKKALQKVIEVFQMIKTCGTASQTGLLAHDTMASKTSKGSLVVKMSSYFYWQWYNNVITAQTNLLKIIKMVQKTLDW